MKRVHLGCAAMLAVALIAGCKKKEEVPTPTSPTETAPTAPEGTKEEGAKMPEGTKETKGTSSIVGKIVFKGNAPVAKKAAMDADPNCKALHKEGKSFEEVVVNKNGTLKNVFVHVKDGLGNQKYPTPTEPVTLDQKGCWYHPHVFGIQVNQPLVILNSDPTLHNVHSMPTKSAPFNLGMPLQGMKMTKTFASSEVMVRFKCDVHGWMSAYAGVLEHPFYGISDNQGQFSLKNLPAGKYTIEAWHEKYGTKMASIEVGAGESKTVDFTYQGS